MGITPFTLGKTNFQSVLPMVVLLNLGKVRMLKVEIINCDK